MKAPLSRLKLTVIAHEDREPLKTENSIKEVCIKATIELMPQNGMERQVRIAFEKDQLEADRLLLERRESWPLNVYGMPLVRLIL